MFRKLPEMRRRKNFIYYLTTILFIVFTSVSKSKKFAFGKNEEKKPCRKNPKDKNSKWVKSYFVIN